MAKTAPDSRNKVIVFSFAVILILLLLWGWNKGPNNTIINKGGSIDVDTPRFPDYEFPPLTLPAFGGNRWDWMQTTDCSCDCGPKDAYNPVTITGPSIYIYRAAPAQYNLPTIAPMPAAQLNLPALEAPKKGSYYRDVWSNKYARWAIDDADRSTRFGDAKEAFRADDGRVFLIGTKTKISGVAETEYYFDGDGDLHYKGKTYVHEAGRDRYRWTPDNVQGS